MVSTESRRIVCGSVCFMPTPWRKKTVKLARVFACACVHMHACVCAWEREREHVRACVNGACVCVWVHVCG
jgi:hypothetical protein